MNKVTKRVLISVGILFLFLGAVGYIWTQFGYEASPSALDDMVTTDAVTVLNGKNIVFFPKGEVKPIGIVFYPGAKVAPEAYAPILMKIAEQGYEVVEIRMPFNLAVFDSNAVEDVLKDRQDKDWVIAGHSLGGAMAAAYVSGHPNANVKGLLLWAAYTDDKHSLKEATLPVASIYGSKDMGLEAIEANKGNLPEQTQFYEIEGGNHAQFGEYGPQKGDNSPEISAEEQQMQIVAYSVKFLNEIVK